MYFIYYNLISFSILGYGLFINHFFKVHSKNLGIIGFIGIFFLTLVSYSSSLFIAHNYYFNLLILTIGLLLILYFLINSVFLKKDLLIFFLVFSFLFIFILVGKNHDDFPYYHFPYIHLLTQDSHPFGLGQLNNGFRNQSSLFFLNSLFYLPNINIYFYHVGPVFFLGFANLFFLKNIFNKKNFKKFRFYNFINLFFLIFINVFFSRLSEYGTDRLGSILIILAFIILLYLINDNSKSSKYNDELTKFFMIIGCITISMKPFYLIYFSLLFFLIYYTHLNQYLFKFLKSKLFFLTLVFIFFTFFINYINSGCFVFPAAFTCNEKLQWSISKQEVENVKIWYELWAKGGATPNFVVDDRINYISNFNWIHNWINVYFFNKMSDFLLSISLLSIIFFSIFRSKKSFFYKRGQKWLILFLILYLIEWFLFHPSLRYGGYHLFILLISIPLVVKLEKYQLSWSSFLKRASILILITIIIFIGRNVARINKEFKVYDYNFFENMNYKFIGGDKDFYFRYDKILSEKKFDHDYIEFFGKKILIIKN